MFRSRHSVATVRLHMTAYFPLHLTELKDDDKGLFAMALVNKVHGVSVIRAVLSGVSKKASRITIASFIEAFQLHRNSQNYTQTILDRLGQL